MNFDIGIQIVEQLIEGKKPPEIQKELGMTPSIFNSRFDEIREAAGLPKEKRAYQACSELVMANLVRLELFEKKLSQERAAYRESLNQFCF